MNHKSTTLSRLVNFPSFSDIQKISSEIEVKDENAPADEPTSKKQKVEEPKKEVVGILSNKLKL